MTKAVEEALETLETAAYCKDEGVTSGPLGMEIRQARATLAAHIAEQDAEIAHMRTQQAAVWRYLQSVSPWSESNDMDWADEIICGIDGLRAALEAK